MRYLATNESTKSFRWDILHIRCPYWVQNTTYNRGVCEHLPEFMHVWQSIIAFITKSTFNTFLHATIHALNCILKFGNIQAMWFIMISFVNFSHCLLYWEFNRCVCKRIHTDDCLNFGQVSLEQVCLFIVQSNTLLD